MYIDGFFKNHKSFSSRISLGLIRRFRVETVVGRTVCN